MNTDTLHDQRPSRFLKQRIECFVETLAFFSRQTQFKVAFLLQLDFWDWEMDEILYAVANFSEREKAWRVSGRTADEMLVAGGIHLKNKAIGSYGPSTLCNRVIAPQDDLAKLVCRWNDLLSECERMLDRNCIAQMVKTGGKALQDLTKYRKNLTS
ncbi:MAG TPA: hypothetical protein VGE67_16015 [Haloferula sp.]